MFTFNLMEEAKKKHAKMNKLMSDFLKGTLVFLINKQALINEQGT